MLINVAPRGEFRNGRLLALVMLLIPGLSVQVDVVRADVHVIDDSERSLRLPRPAQRIVSLAPHITEILFAIDADRNLAGTTDTGGYPPGAETIEQVGNASRLDLEAIVALQPDLVIAWRSGNPAAQVSRLEELDMPVFFSEPRRLEDVATTVERLGVLAGRPAIARRVSHRFTAKVAALRNQFQHRPALRVFYQVWNAPLVSINGQHIISDVIALCGGTNVFADLPALAPQVGIESVLAADPDVIVGSGSSARRPPWLDDWRRWPSLAAVRGNHIYAISPFLLQRHTPRLAQGAEQLCEYLEQARLAKGY